MPLIVTGKMPPTAVAVPATVLPIAARRDA
jgi:hypothetical protein